MNILELTSLAIAISFGIGGMIAFIYKGRGDQTIKLQQADIDIYRDRAERYERDALEAKSKADILENKVVQAQSIDKLINQIASQHSEQIKAFTEMTNKLGDLTEAITATYGGKNVSRRTQR